MPRSLLFDDDSKNSDINQGVLNLQQVNPDPLNDNINNVVINHQPNNEIGVIGAFLNYIYDLSIFGLFF